MTLSYLIKRLLYIAITLVLVSIVIFFVTNVLPGDAAVMILGEYATPDAIKALTAKLGLDKPVYIQYLQWAKGILTGDLGNSLTMNVPIAEIVAFRLANSAMVAVPTLVLVSFIAVPLGVWASIRQNSLPDRSIQLISYIGISIPEFATATILIILFAGPLFDLFPSGGFVAFTEDPLKCLYHLILPISTMIVILIAHIMRQTRSEMLDVLRSNYVRAARLKGLPVKVVIFKHALRNALLPTVTVLAMDVGYLIGSMVVVEEVFAYPGLGRLTVYAVANRDIPLLQICSLTIAAVYTISNFLADIVYAWLNPKIRYE